MRAEVEEKVGEIRELKKEMKTLIKKTTTAMKTSFIKLTMIESKSFLLNPMIRRRWHYFLIPLAPQAYPKE